MVDAGATRTVAEVTDALHRTAQRHRRRHTENAVGVAQDAGGRRHCEPYGLSGDSATGGIFAHRTRHRDARSHAAAHRLGHKKHGGHTARPRYKTAQ